MIRLDDAQAKHANIRHSIRLQEACKIDVLDVYCEKCRKAWDAVSTLPCDAAESNDHLRGGPIGRRRRHDQQAACE